MENDFDEYDLPVNNRPLSKFRVEETKDSQGNPVFRCRYGGHDVNADAIKIFLDYFAHTGLKMQAAMAAGISYKVIQRLTETDKEFQAAVMEAEAMYAERVVAHHQKLVFEGSERVIYNRHGDVVSREKIVYPKLIELELKKVDERYRDKRELDVRVTPGVLVAPRDADSVDDWVRKYGSGPIIDNEDPDADGNSDSRAIADGNSD